MSQNRHFENDLSVLAANDSAGCAALVREMLKAAAVALKEAKAAAVSHKDVSGGSIYVGVGGLALTYLRMAQQLQRGFRYAHGSYLKKHNEKHCLKLAEQFLDEADKLMSLKRVTFLEGVSGIKAAQALLAHMKGQDNVMQDRIKDLEDLWSSKIQGVLPDDECELLYGRAGYLYSLAWLQQQIKQDHIISRALIKDVIRHILDAGMRGAQQLRDESPDSSVSWGLMYKWHDKRYLGAAHGLCGILYLLLHYFPIVEELDRERVGGVTGGSSYVAAVGRSVDALAAAALPSGNLPAVVGGTSDERVAWCHGGPGLILIMIKASAVLRDVDGRYNAAAVAAAKDIWNRGLLKKGVGLCHGVCGNGYALLALARASDDLHQQKQWLAAARAFGGFAAQHWKELYFTPDRPASLFEGIAGAVNFWLDVAENHPEQRWPGAEL